jgi:hypothetical protein
MPALKTRRVPGVYVRSEVTPPPEALPRMDIAAFVGLASRGPVNVPVAVEDVGRFRDIFGSDLRLAWDPVVGRHGTSFLGPAVEAFFKGGGRRCWVVRVAEAATTNSFDVPTVLDAVTGRPALARARAAGSWSDPLQVSTVLSQQIFAVDAAVADGTTYELTVRGTIDQFLPGDVVRCFCGDTRFYLRIADRQVLRDRLRLRGDRIAAYQSTRSPVESAAFARATLVSARGPAFDADLGVATLIPAATAYRLEWDSIPGALPRRGDVVHATIEAGSEGAGRTVWLSISDVFQSTADASIAEPRLIAQSSDAHWPVDAAPAVAPGLVERLSFSMLVWQEEEVLARLDRLGFGAPGGNADPPVREQSRFWASLPTDEALFEDALEGRSVSRMIQEASMPRFPMAGPSAVATMYVPLGMPIQPDRSVARSSTDRHLSTTSSTTLERDGLADFTPRWFLDSDLAGSGQSTLDAAVFQKRYVAGQSLNGVHGIWTLDEVSLISVPDAVQPGWIQRRPEFPPDLAAPPTPAAEHVAELEAFRLDWSGSIPETGGEYELQESTTPAFDDSVVRYRGSQTHAYVYLETTCRRRFHYRVRRVDDGRVSPWSGTAVIVPSLPGFEACRRPVATPVLTLDRESVPTRLIWTGLPDADHYTLEQGADPAFHTARTLVDRAVVLDYELDPLPEEIRYYRVRAGSTDESGETTEGAWSVTVRFVPDLRSTWTMRTPDEYDEAGRADLLAFHRSLLRFCAVRADLVAILSLPRHYRAEAAAAYVASLTPDTSDDEEFEDAGTTGIPPLAIDEERALSFGALYHPWISSGNGALRDGVLWTPPDGVVAGFMARRTRQRGAWIAPANEPFGDVLALSPDFDQADWQRMLDRSVNLLRQTPRGFMPFSSDTLSVTEDLRPLGVRRLMILLRRLALREGEMFVFESNTSDLRRRVQFRFEGLLEGLFRRGAFAGTTPAEAFHVRTDEAVNPPESVDRGQLVVELRVAPSRPLEYLLVRLIQRNTGGFTISEG